MDDPTKKVRTARIQIRAMAWALLLMVPIFIVTSRLGVFGPVGEGTEITGTQGIVIGCMLMCFMVGLFMLLIATTLHEIEQWKEDEDE